MLACAASLLDAYLDALDELGGGLGQDSGLVDHLFGVGGLGEHFVGDCDDGLHTRFVCGLLHLLLGAVPARNGGSTDSSPQTIPFNMSTRRISYLVMSSGLLGNAYATEIHSGPTIQSALKGLELPSSGCPGFRPLAAALT